VIVDLHIEVVILGSNSREQLEVVLISPIAGANQSAELWRAQESGAYALYHQDAYYNDTLMTSRAAGRMRHPRHKHELMTLVGNVWGSETWSSEDSWELARMSVTLHSVSVDEP
jgi:hypothetical protein